VPQSPALPAGEHPVSEPVSQHSSRFPLSDDLTSLQCPLPEHGAGVGVALGWADRVLTRLRRPQLLIYWIRFWNEQADGFSAPDAAATAPASRDGQSAGSLRLFAAARAETPRLGAAGRPDRLRAFIETGDAALADARGEVLAAMRTTLGVLVPGRARNVDGAALGPAGPATRLRLCARHGRGNRAAPGRQRGVTDTVPRPGAAPAS
jgi:hypothetical protein